MSHSNASEDETTDRVLLPDDPQGPPPADREATVMLDDGRSQPTPHQPASHQPFSSEAPTPPPTQSQSPQRPHNPSAPQDFESLTSTGFMPPTAPASPDEGPASSPSPGWKDSLPDALKRRTFKAKDDAETADRIQFGGGGVLVGAVLGTFLGLVNTVLQGWHISQGASQIFGLAALLAISFGCMGALRPRRIQSLLQSINRRLS